MKGNLKNLSPHQKTTGVSPYTLKDAGMSRWCGDLYTKTVPRLSAKSRMPLKGAGWFFCLVLLIAVVQVVPLRGWVAFASPSDDLQDGLRQQISALQAQIDEYRSSISNLQQQGKTLKREISLLDSKIKAAELEIRQADLSIKQTEIEIASKNVEIGQAELKIGREQEILGEYIRMVNNYDQGDFLEAILTDEKLSDIFDRINSLENVQQSIQQSMVALRETKDALKNNLDVLEQQKDELNQLKVLQQIQKQALATQQVEKKDLLSQTKGQETNFQNLIAKAKSDANSIRKQLYLLEGVGLSMPLEEAYRYAKRAADLTGVRPAFLLAVLKKESSWGEKVGTGTWRKDMHKRDQQAFIEITEKLGLDPDKTPVSRKPSYGWGGAMGPAQFLPSVWLSYEAQIAQLTGHNPPDPWDIGDAFVGAAIKLAQGGANARTENAEWKAAQIYFAGSRWNKPAYYFYGDQVMELAGVIQGQLDIIAK